MFNFVFYSNRFLLRSKGHAFVNLALIESERYGIVYQML